MSVGARGPGAYARAVEQALSRLRERPTVLSPRDWSLVVDWHARGVPVAVVLEALEEAAARSRSRGQGGGPRSLAYVAPAVEEAWSLILAGRGDRVGPLSVTGPTPESVRASWERAGRAGDGGAALRALIDDLLRRLDEGTPAEEIDAELNRRLAGCLPAERVEQVERGVDAELAPFRERMSEGTFGKTRERAIVSRLRQIAGLPLLSGGSTPPPDR